MVVATTTSEGEGLGDSVGEVPPQADAASKATSAQASVLTGIMMLPVERWFHRPSYGRGEFRHGVEAVSGAMAYGELLGEGVGVGLAVGVGVGADGLGLGDGDGEGEGSGGQPPPIGVSFTCANGVSRMPSQTK